MLLDAFFIFLFEPIVTNLTYHFQMLVNDILANGQAVVCTEDCEGEMLFKLRLTICQVWGIHLLGLKTRNGVLVILNEVVELFLDGDIYLLTDG